MASSAFLLRGYLTPFVLGREMLRIAEIDKGAMPQGRPAGSYGRIVSLRARCSAYGARTRISLLERAVIDDERWWRWWKLARVAFIDHRVVHETELWALDLTTRRAAHDGPKNEVVALQLLLDHACE